MIALVVVALAERRYIRQQKAEVKRQRAEGHLFGRSLNSHQTSFALKGEACIQRDKVEVNSSAFCPPPKRVGGVPSALQGGSLGQ